MTLYEWEKLINKQLLSDLMSYRVESTIGIMTAEDKANFVNDCLAEWLMYQDEKQEEK